MPTSVAQPPGQASAEAAASGLDHSAKYIPTLDGWRAVAILWVILSHNQLYLLGPLSTQYVLDTGDHGVQLFFALSGLLICGLMAREEEQTGRISLRGFYTRRVFRIQPAALIYLLTALLLGLIGVTPNFWQGVVGAVLMVRNFWPPEFGTVYWLTSHFWSLSVEEHFYLVLPLFLVVVKRYRLAVLCVTMALVELWRIHVLRTPSLQRLGWLFYLRTDMVVGGILLGCTFAIALRRPPIRGLADRWLRPWLALTYALAVLAEQQYHHSTYDHMVLMTVYPVVITATMLHPRSLASKFLELPVLRYIGRISYSLYLWQQMFFYKYMPPRPGTLRSRVLLCWMLVFAIATLSYHLVERPLVRRGHKLASRFASPPLPPDAVEAAP